MQCQVIIPVNIYTSNVIWAELVIFRDIYVYEFTYNLALTITEKRTHEFEGK